jgi:hypothetical protein
MCSAKRGFELEGVRAAEADAQPRGHGAEVGDQPRAHVEQPPVSASIAEA